jgi:hypothetical protein
MIRNIVLFVTKKKANHAKMSNQFVDYENYSPENMKGSEPIPKEITKTKGKEVEKIKYHELKLSYNYGDSKNPNIQDVYFEGCVVIANGFTSKEEEAMGKKGPYIKKECSMMQVFNVVDPEFKDDSLNCINKITELYKKARQIIFTHRNKLKMHDFIAEGQGGLFKYPIYWPRDEVTGEIVEGKNPNIWVKMRTGNYNKTIFTDLNGNNVEWSLLKGSEVTMIPLYHFEKIYLGTKMSLQIYLSSAVVIKIKKIGSESRQLSSLERLKQKYAAEAEDLEAQLAELRMEKQDLLANQISQSQGSYSSNFDGPDPDGNMHTSVEMTQETNLEDFLADAPTMEEQQSPEPQPKKKPASIRLPMPK